MKILPELLELLQMKRRRDIHGKAKRRISATFPAKTPKPLVLVKRKIWPEIKWICLKTVFIFFKWQRFKFLYPYKYKYKGKCHIVHITHINIVWAGQEARIPETKKIIRSKFVLCFQFLTGVTADAGVFSDVETAARYTPAVTCVFGVQEEGSTSSAMTVAVWLATGCHTA